MSRPCRWWRKERNDATREERRNAVREAGAHSRWSLEPSSCRCIADYANVFGVRCPRTFRAYSTKLDTESWQPNEESPF